MNTEWMFHIPSETTEIEVRKDYLPAFAFHCAYVSDTGVQSCEYCVEEKARHLRVLEDASRKVFADDSGYKGNLLNGKGEIISFELTNGYCILLVPDIATPVENPRVRAAMAQIFVSIHALRHTVFVDGKRGLGWDFAQPDILALDPHPHSPLAVIGQGI